MTEHPELEIGYLACAVHNFCDTLTRHRIELDDLEEPAHRVVLGAICARWDRGQAHPSGSGVSIAGVIDDLRDADRLTKPLQELLYSLPSVGLPADGDVELLAAQLSRSGRRRRARAALVAASLAVERRDLDGARARLAGIDEILAPRARKPALVTLSDLGDGDPLGSTPPPMPILLTVDAGDDRVGFLPRGTTVVVSGAPGAGKTFLACGISLAVASRAWARCGDLRVASPGRVVYIAAENRSGRLTARMHYTSTVHGYSEAERREIAKRLTIAEPGEDGAQLGEMVDGRLGPSRWLRSITTELARLPGDVSLVVVDTLARTGPQGVEEDPSVATHFLALLEQAFTKLPGSPCVLVVHHPTKLSESESKAWPRLFSRTSSRGSGAIPGAAGCVANLVVVSRGRRDHLALGIAKANDVREGLWVPFVRGPHGVLVAPSPGEREKIDAALEREKSKPGREAHA